MDKMQDIIFFVIATTVILVLLGVLIINLLLIGRNKALKHKNDLLKMAAEYQKEVMVTQIEVMENTFSDISQQLHDDVGQMIAFSIVQLNNIQTTDKNFQTEINNVRESVQSSMQSVREISKTLSPDYVKSFGLVESLERLLSRVHKVSGIEIQTTIAHPIIFNTQSNSVFTFRILQELITNTMKHAKATNITLSIKDENEHITLTYADNGKGIKIQSVDELQSKQSMGFANIIKRTALMNGKIEIATIEQGFKLILSIPNK